MASQEQYDEAKQMCIDHLTNQGGNVSDFRIMVEEGHQRLGQAFFNAMPAWEKERVRGRTVDPFFVNTDQLPQMVANLDHMFSG